MFDYNGKNDPRNGHLSEMGGQKNSLKIHQPSMLIPKHIAICQGRWAKLSYEIPRGYQNEYLITRSISFYFLLVDEVYY